MAYSACVLSFKKGHRLYETISTLVIGASAISISACAVAGQSIPKDINDNMALGGIQIALDVKIPASAFVFAIALQGRKADEIQLNLIDAQPTPEEANASRGVNEVIKNIFAPAFSEFYEQHKEWMRNNLGRDLTNWPPTLYFGRTIRNCIAHDGKIRITDTNAKPATWYNLSYSAEDNGREVFFKDLSMGDLLILMLEMSDELDRLGCPLNP
jgi:hypothetical protein